MADQVELPNIVSDSCRNLVFDTIFELARLNSASQISLRLAEAAALFGFSSLGINGLPPQECGADPLILMESAPTGFRELYIHERFYLVDHICAHTRAAAAEPFCYSEAPYDPRQSRSHRRFMEALQTFGIGKGIVVPIGRQAHIPACVWLAGENPDLHDDAKRAMQLIGLFAATKSYALGPPPAERIPVLSEREREVMCWTARGKSAWQIGEILGIAKRTVDAHAQAATSKLGAANRTQAVVFALLRNIIEI